MQKFFWASLPAPTSIRYLPVYSMKWITHSSSQGLYLLGFFPYPLIIFPIIITDHWSMLITFFISMLRLWSSNVLWFWATQIPKSDVKNEYGPLEIIEKKTFVKLSRFWPLSGLRKSLTTIIFQKMLDKVLKSCKKNISADLKANVKHREIQKTS